MDNVDLSAMRASRLILDMEQSAMAYKRARKDAARADAFAAWRRALRDLAQVQRAPVENTSTASAAGA